MTRVGFGLVIRVCSANWLIGFVGVVGLVVVWFHLLIGLFRQATKASAAQSRVKMLAKMEANAAPLPEGKSTFKAKIKLPTPPACHTKQARIQYHAFIHSYLTSCYLALPGQGATVVLVAAVVVAVVVVVVVVN